MCGNIAEFGEALREESDLWFADLACQEVCALLKKSAVLKRLQLDVEPPYEP